MGGKTRSKPILLRPAALFIFLSAAARARIVAANLVAPNHLLHGCSLSRSRHARLLQFATFLALEGFFHIIHRCGSPAPASSRTESSYRIAIPIRRR